MTALVVAALAASFCVPLKPEAERITASDLAQLWPALAQAPADTLLGFAPAPGVQRVFAGTELHRIAVRLHLAAEPEAPLCVERPRVALERERMLAAMQRAWPGARIEILDAARGVVPAGEVEFPRAQWQPSGLWRGYVAYAPHRRFGLWARVKLRVPGTRVVAAERLAAGRAVAAAQVRLETAEAPPSALAPAETLEEVIGRIPRLPIAAGAVVTRAQLAPPLDVVRGQTVRVEARQGAAYLELEGRAEADGRRGDRIAVSNLTSGKRFPARVTGPGTVAAGGGGTGI